MGIYHNQAVQFLINQITPVSDQLKMQKCRTMNHHEKCIFENKKISLCDNGLARNG